MENICKKILSFIYTRFREKLYVQKCSSIAFGHIIRVCISQVWKNDISGVSSEHEHEYLEQARVEGISDF